MTNSSKKRGDLKNKEQKSHDHIYTESYCNMFVEHEGKITQETTS